MSFYDDLGLRRGATAEEVREKYRVLVRLFHPDQFADPVLKAAAESQMRRFNEIEAVLTDPKLRREYDDALWRRPGTIKDPPIIIQAAQPVRQERRIPRNSVAWGAALMACAGAIVWVSDHDASPAPPQMEARGEDWRARARAAIAERDQARHELARIRTGWTRRFTGVWSQARNASPEHIETQITERDGQMRGQYRSPTVNFEFTGQAADASAQMPFVRDDGARGEVRLRLISEHELELAWTAAETGTPSRGSGTALLVRDQ